MISASSAATGLSSFFQLSKLGKSESSATKKFVIKVAKCLSKSRPTVAIKPVLDLFQLKVIIEMDHQLV